MTGCFFRKTGVACLKVKAQPRLRARIRRTKKVSRPRTATLATNNLMDKQKSDNAGWLRRMVGRQCVTHHHACDCRETRLLATLKPLAQELLNHGKNGDETAFCAYVDINEMWVELYGCEILDDARFLPPNDQAQARRAESVDCK